MVVMDTTRRYTFSSGTRASAIVCIASLLLFTVFPCWLIWWSDEPRHAIIGSPVLIGLCISIVWAIRFYTRIYDSVLLTAQALVYESTKGTSVTVPWEQIVGLVPHSVRRRYDVLDARGACRMQISYELDNFAELEATLRNHLQKSSPNGTMTWFAKPAGGRVIVAICGGVLALLMFGLWFDGMNSKSLFVAALLVVGMAWGSFFRIEKVIIGKEGILLGYWKRKIAIPYASIKNLNLQEDYLPGAWRDIRIERFDYRPTKIEWLADEAASLHQDMEAAWKAATSLR